MGTESRDEFENLLTFSDDFTFDKFVGHCRIGDDIEFEVSPLPFGD